MPGLVPGITDFWPALKDVDGRDKPGHAVFTATLAYVVTVAMQVGAVRVKPGLGAAHLGADAFNQAPEAARMIHIDEMRDFMSREIVEDKRRRQNESP